VLTAATFAFAFFEERGQIGLNQLRDCAVVTKEQAVIWDELRQRVAHGRIVDYNDAQLWERHATLITMFHRLVLRLIGY
jgi:hypothetical protein